MRTAPEAIAHDAGMLSNGKKTGLVLGNLALKGRRWNSPGASPPGPARFSWPRRSPRGYRVGSIAHTSPDAFRQIGHSLTARLVATLGGVLTRHRYRADARDGYPAEPTLVTLAENSTTGSQPIMAKA